MSPVSQDHLFLGILLLKDAALSKFREGSLANTVISLDLDTGGVQAIVADLHGQLIARSKRQSYVKS